MVSRPMDFAGNWYPASPRACEAKIEGFWREPLADDSPRGLYGVAPHAGWVYSGALAGRVYQALSGGEDVPLVVVLGGHLRSGDALVAMTEGEWETPFGSFTIDQGFRSILEKFSPVKFETPLNYRPDNSTELQLPFAKLKFPNARLLPMRVPPGGLALEVGKALGEYLSRNFPGAAVVASTDLTHYGPNFGFQPKGRGVEALSWVREVNDPAFIKAVEGGDSREVLESAGKKHNACSAGAVAALMEIAGGVGLKFSPLGYSNSADSGSGDKENFVGYVGGLFS